jgi:predicted alternative tryptophan synthase beta-subunit
VVGGGARFSGVCVMSVSSRKEIELEAVAVEMSKVPELQEGFRMFPKFGGDTSDP